MLNSLVVALAHLCCTGFVADGAVGEVVLTGGERFAGQVVGFSDGAIQVATAASEPQTIAAGDWLRWRHPADVERRPTVYFGTRSMLVAKQDWTGKVPIVIAGDEVTVDNATFGKTRLRRSDVRCLLVEAAKEPATAQHLLREALIAAAADRVWLVEGDLLTGRIIGFDGTHLELELAGQTLPVLAKRVAALAFKRPSESTEAGNGGYLVGLEDGSVVEAASMALADNHWSLRSSGGHDWKTSNGQHLCYLQSLASTINYLSDRDAIDFKHTPYFSGQWPLGRDQSLAGGRLKVGGQYYSKGLAMHSASRVVYQVPLAATKFCADIALDESAGSRGSAVYRVYRLTDAGIEPAFESQVIRGEDSPQSIEVDVARAKAVVLVVDFADRGDELDRANWLDARFVH